MNAAGNKTQNIRDSIDLPALSDLMRRFSAVTGIPFLLVDTAGEVLISTCGDDFCNHHIEPNKDAAANCIRSRERIQEEPKLAQPYSLFTCQNGLSQAACPVYVDGRHVATIILCHFLISDEQLEARRKAIIQRIRPFASVDENAVQTIPVRSPGDIERIMLFYLQLARIIGEGGSQHDRLLQLLHKEQLLNENLNNHVEAQQLAEKQLLESRRRIEILLSNLPGMAYRCRNDRLWTMELVSDVCLEISGYSASELTENASVSWSDVIHPDDREMVWNKVQKAVELREHYTIDYRVITKDGSLRHVREKGKALFEASGRCQALEGFIMDVTDEILTREKLSINEQRFKIFAENARDVIFRMKLPERSYEYISPAAQEMFGRPIGDFYQTPLLFLTHVHPESQDFIRQLFEQLERNEVIPPSCEYRIISLNGTVKWVYQRSACFTDSKGRITAVEGILTDITELKEIQSALKKSERQLIAAQKLGLIGHWEYDLKTRLITGSDQALSLCGISPAENRRTLSIDELLASVFEEDRTRVASVFRNSVLNQSDFETEWRHGEQGERCLHVIARFDREPKHDSTHLGGTIQDVTGQRSLEKQLAHAQKMEAVGRLAGGVAHDFNNLLQAIIGYADVILDKACEVPSILQDVDKIINAGEKARRMIKQLLTFGRDEDFAPVPVDLNEVTASLLDILRRLAGDSCEIVFQPSPEIGKTRADSGRMEQVLMNLVVNARDAMPTGGRILIGTATASLNEAFCEGFPELLPGEYVRLFVEDGGSGIPERVMERLFEPFFTTKDREHGSGLGLATTYAIVRRHSGCITAQNNPSGGATFTVYLPRMAESIPANAQVPGVQPLPTDAVTILLAEDNDMIRPLSENVLSRRGYRIITARDGDEAVELFHKNREQIGLLILDIVMPNKTGVNAYKEISASAPNLPVLFCTGFNDDLLKSDYLMKIPGLLLHKPYTNKELLTAVRTLLKTN